MSGIPEVDFNKLELDRFIVNLKEKYRSLQVVEISYLNPDGNRISVESVCELNRALGVLTPMSRDKIKLAWCKRFAKNENTL